MEEGSRDFIVPIENKLVYTDFDKENPGISRIIVFNSNNYTDIDGATEVLYGSEKGKYSNEQARRVIEEVFGEGFINQYYASMFRNTQRYDRPTERGKSRSDAYHARQSEKRRGFHVDDEGNVVWYSLDVPTTYALDEELSDEKLKELFPGSDDDIIAYKDNKADFVKSVILWVFCQTINKRLI